jgi:hypothetical protein
MKVRDIEWWIVGILGVTAFFMAIFGFDMLYTEAGIKRSFIDYAFQSIKIFGMEFPDEFDSPLPIPLEIARWLAPAVILYTATKAVIYFIRREFNSLLIQSKRDHIIINSLNEQSRFLISDLLDKGKKVIVVSAIENPKKLDKLEKQGAIVVDGDLHSDKFLKNIAAHNAKYFILMQDNDETNISDAMTIYDYLVKKGRHKKQIIYTHVADDIKLTELKELNFFEEFTKKIMKELNCEIRIFSSYERISRFIFNTYSPDIYNPVFTEDDDQLHVAVIGSGKLVQSMIIRLARLGHYANLKKLKVSVFYDNGKLPSILERNFPRLKELIDINYYNTDLTIFNGDNYEKIHAEHPISVTYMLCENDSLSTSILNKLSKVKTIKNLDIVLTLINPDGILSKYYDAKQIESITLHKFIIRQKAFTGDAILSEKLDEMAKIIHEDYYNRQKEQGKLKPEKKASHNPWELLPVELQNQNREQADHMMIKLRAIDNDQSKAINRLNTMIEKIKIANTKNTPEEGIDRITIPEIELLSELEHNRWCAHMILSGYVLGEKSDDKLKTHTDLVPYEELSGFTKQWDRNAVKNIPVLMSKKDK